MSFQRRAISLILPVMLLLAQHGALAHMISHLDAGQWPANEKTLVHLKLCGKCVSAEKLFHAAPTLHIGIVAMDSGYLRVDQSGFACISQDRWAYRSRAPPHFL